MSTTTPSQSEGRVLAALASSDADYARLGISKDHIEQWEDGARTDNGKGTYEWWYFDAHLDNGAKLVIVFTNKPMSSPQKPLAPTIRLNLDLPDGRSIEKEQPYPANEWSAATDHADVRIAHNRFTGNLHEYQIAVSIDGIDVDVTLVGDVPSWRPETGFTFFGKDRNLEFAWLPSVPQGSVTASYTVDGETTTSTGVGYHDHNWGNVPLMEIIHDWYWARGQAGPYSTITAFITAHEKYDYDTVTTFLLAKDGKIVADDATKVTFERENIYTDEVTGKPVAGTTRYTYADGDERYVVSYVRAEDLTKSVMIDNVHGIERALAKAAHFDGSYQRLTGTCTVQHFVEGNLVDEYSDPAIWELMYFGHAR